MSIFNRVPHPEAKNISDANITRFELRNIGAFLTPSAKDHEEALHLFKKYPNVYHPPDLFDPFTERERLEASIVISLLPGIQAHVELNTQIQSPPRVFETVTFKNNYQLWLQYSRISEDGVRRQKYGLSMFKNGKFDLPMASFVGPQNLKLLEQSNQSVLQESLRVPGTVFVEKLSSGSMVAMRLTAGQSEPNIYLVNNLYER